MGEIGILNVGAGDNKLVFDKNDPAAMARAARMVKDMIRRGYVLLVEVGKDEKGVAQYQRATDFKEDTCEYIIADFDSAVASEEDSKEGENDKGIGGAKTQEMGTAPERARRSGKRKSSVIIPAHSTRAIAVGRTAGG